MQRASGRLVGGGDAFSNVTLWESPCQLVSHVPGEPRWEEEEEEEFDMDEAAVSAVIVMVFFHIPCVCI